ncbi:sperm acrosome membrane-associated protein 4-like [Rhineura floridana]|uniref:sperm acrosome membrane-associated protein 4-like n=1 Tax=Rhineura floridana TaxID=261503 RepID=UPI002AC80495|nr:sperm acrosome membrane-associated protein 4-like [Rhineura floridana]
MGKLLVLCVAVLACISLGSALQCLKCSFTVFDIPCHTTTTTCEAGQVCATIRGTAAGRKLIMKRNCVDQNKCNRNDSDTYLGINYITTYNCCEGDFCNSAATVPASHLSLPIALAMMGVWLIRLL